MNLLAFVFVLELTWLPSGIIEHYSTQYQTPNTFKTQLEAEAIFFDWIFIGGSVATFIHADRLDNYEPTSLLYGVRMGLRHKWFEAFWRHYCQHPQKTYMRMRPDIIWEGAYNEIGIRIEG